jgi:hypothetical protein
MKRAKRQYCERFLVTDHHHQYLAVYLVSNGGKACCHLQRYVQSQSQLLGKSWGQSHKKTAEYRSLYTAVTRRGCDHLVKSQHGVIPTWVAVADAIPSARAEAIVPQNGFIRRARALSHYASSYQWPSFLFTTILLMTLIEISKTLSQKD